ncbi:MAG: ankyrin repeat-containing domain protein [Monoraphidium minutum]|nr:MAG: ankyrin repeat-containing domain protein [Monoraphidium minutum]
MSSTSVIGFIKDIKALNVKAAVQVGCLPIVEELLRAGADVGARDAEEQTPLHWACATSGGEAPAGSAIAAALIAAGADVHAKDGAGRTALRVAAAKAPPLIGSLLGAGVVPGDVDGAGQAACHAAAVCGRLDSIEALAAAGADVGRQDAAGWTPLMLLLCHGHVAQALQLLAAGDGCGRCAIHAQESLGGRTALAVACSVPWERSSSGQQQQRQQPQQPVLTEAVSALLAAGASPGVRLSGGDTVLMAAVRAGHLELAQQERRQAAEELVAALLGRGARLRAGEGEALFNGWWAARNDRLCALVVPALPAATLGVLPLRHEECAAAGMPHTAVAVLVRASLESGSDWRGPQDEAGNTHLMLAAAVAADLGSGGGGGGGGGGAALLCAALVAAGLPVDAVDRAGDTALILAARRGDLDICKALVACGADPLRRNAKNRTAGAQLRLEAGVAAFLAEAEAGARAARAARDKALWDAPLAATQTASACAVRAV